MKKLILGLALFYLTFVGYANSAQPFPSKFPNPFNFGTNQGNGNGKPAIQFPKPPCEPNQEMPYPSQFQSQGEYSTLTLNERGTIVTQENVIDHKDNIMINTVPQHNGREAAKFVFDGDSDLMMLVTMVRKTCEVQKSFLPWNISASYTNLRRNAMLDTREKKNIRVVKKDFLMIGGFEISHNALPIKFQPHCPPGFQAFSSHMVDKEKATIDDPYLMNADMETIADMFDYKPQLTLSGFRSSTARCRLMYNKTTTVPYQGSCSVVQFDCNNGDGSIHGNGCPHADYAWHCLDTTSNCVYQLMNCYDENGVFENNCMWHLQVQGKCCRPCCNGRKCDAIPACRDVENEVFQCNRDWGQEN